MICYVVIDTNILVSSLLTSNYDASTVKVVNKIFNKELIPIFSKPILDEYDEVLRRKKFKFNVDLIDNFLNEFKRLGKLIEPKTTEEILIDMKDLPFYEVVLEIKDNNGYLVTGNMKHFPDKPYIITASQLLNLLDNSWIVSYIKSPPILKNTRNWWG